MGGVAAPLLSPCTGVCTLDEAERCLGCGRTLDEIARWGVMPAAERAAVMARVAMPGASLDPEAGSNLRSR